MAKRLSASQGAYLAAPPFVFGLIVGNIGGTLGLVLFMFLLLPATSLPLLPLALGHRGQAGWFPFWTLLPLAGLVMGYLAGSTLPRIAEL